MRMHLTASYVIVSLLSVIACTSCSWEEEAVTITKHYVINPNWDEISNALWITKMTLKDTGDSIDLHAASGQDLLNRLMEDTAFSYVTNVIPNGEQYFERRVYFDRRNGFIWRRPPNMDPARSVTYDTIGSLERGHWFMFAGLSNVATLYYVYVDPVDSLHLFRVPASAWTNI